MKFIIVDYRKDIKRSYYVCARPGYCRDYQTGRQKRDGTCPKNSGPEWTDKRDFALEFNSHRAAARIRNKTVSGKIIQTN